ncbi:GtrA family protein, partial [Kaarinaea lacus]
NQNPSHRPFYPVLRSGLGGYLFLDFIPVIAAKYALFAAVSTLLNLLAQYLSFKVYSGYGSLVIAMCFGTLAGLLSKYILDKRYIFYHTPKDRKDDSKKFVLYSFMGLFTTVPFIVCEMMFDYLIDHEGAKYAGALTGLTIGYVSKYFLDKRYVFIER